MTTKEFIEKLNQEAKENNFAVIEKIQAAGKNPEAVYAIAKETGVTDSFEVFQAEMTQAYKNASTELTEEELLAVAGGLTEPEKVTVVGVCASAAAAAGGAAF